jgi:hypothetical protein
MENSSLALHLAKWRWLLFFGLYWPLYKVTWTLSGLFGRILGTDLFLGNVCPYLTCMTDRI